MRLIIDIPKEKYEMFLNNGYAGLLDNELYYDINNGIPIPDNATNGEVIKALFPNEHDFETDFDEDWWNAPYQKGDKE